MKQNAQADNIINSRSENETRVWKMLNEKSIFNDEGFKNLDYAHLKLLKMHKKLVQVFLNVSYLK